ncbi:MAG TPA: cytochrome c-type biogenesis protein CcmH [Acidimicrobiales bacterium]
MRTRAPLVSWIAMAAVVTTALLVGATSDRAPRTEAERVAAIATGVRCPTCRTLSAAESDAVGAQAVRDAIRDGVRAGQSDAEIRAFLVSRYGSEILLKPKASGIAGLVWILPVAALLVALAGLAIAFRRWRRAEEGTPAPTDDDRALVDAALRP